MCCHNARGGHDSIGVWGGGGFGGGLAQGKGAKEHWPWAGTRPTKGEAWGAVGLDPKRRVAFIKICFMVIVKYVPYAPYLIVLAEKIK